MNDRGTMNDQLFSTSFLSLLRRCEKIMVSTGAGISTESGIPSFRGADGLWKKYNPEELATPEAFERDPVKVWEWYDWRRQVIGKAEPNAGHHALVELESLVPRFFLFTQNIDGLHQKAGHTKIHELHGNIWQVRCTAEERVLWFDETPLQRVPPLCDCGALLRPNVVWFGEPLPLDVLELGWSIAGNCDAFFAIGTSGMVHPAASLAYIARESGALVVEINAEPTILTEIAHESFQGKSGSILPELVRSLKNHAG